jgi:hypothetical protein
MPSSLPDESLLPEDDGHAQNLVCDQAIIENASRETQESQRLDELLVVTQDLTLIVKDLPKSLRQSELLQEVKKSGFEGFFNLLYVPRRVRSRNEGYAFINFTCFVAAQAFMKMWHRRERFNHLSNGPFYPTVRNSTSQGLHPNINRWASRHSLRPHELDEPPFVVGVELSVVREALDVSGFEAQFDDSDICSPQSSPLLPFSPASCPLPIGEVAFASNLPTMLASSASRPSADSSQVSIVPSQVRRVQLDVAQNQAGMLVWRL